MSRVETPQGRIDYTYDPNGNLTERTGQGETLAIEWNDANLPKKITRGSASVSFLYDHEGRRAKKGGTIGDLYECTGGVCTKHLFAGGRRLASKTGSTTRYPHTDSPGEPEPPHQKDGGKG